MEQIIVTLCGITDPNLALLADAGVTSGNELAILNQEDIEDILPDAVFMFRKKLVHIGGYIARGESVTATTTLTEIVLYLNTPVPGTENPGPPGLPPVYTPDLNRGAPKLYVNSLADFSGQSIEY
jgi:hypothetical protein